LMFRQEMTEDVINVIFELRLHDTCCELYILLMDNVM
jgi:hypothetical protein